MPRNYQRKGSANSKIKICNAVNAVIQGSSVKAAAKEFGIPRSTLRFHVHKNESAQQLSDIHVTAWGRKTVRPLFIVLLSYNFMFIFSLFLVVKR